MCRIPEAGYRLEGALPVARDVLCVQSASKQCRKRTNPQNHPFHAHAIASFLRISGGRLASSEMMLRNHSSYACAEDQVTPVSCSDTSHSGLIERRLWKFYRDWIALQVEHA